MKILLAALERAQKDIDYYALDLSLSELHRTLAEVPIGEYQHVRCHGLHGTYDDGFEWLQAPENARRPKCVVSLGSSIGNFGRADAASFLKNISDSLNANDIVLIATDGCEDPSRVHHAYNDRHGITHSFYRNGLRQVNRLLGQELFVQDEFDIIGEFNAEACRHQAFVSPRRDIELGGFTLARGEKIHIENAHKYPSRLLTQLWADASFTPKISLADSRGDYRETLLLICPVLSLASCIIHAEHIFCVMHVVALPLRCLYKRLPRYDAPSAVETQLPSHSSNTATIRDEY